MACCGDLGRQAGKSCEQHGFKDKQYISASETGLIKRHLSLYLELVQDTYDAELNTQCRPLPKDI